MTTIIINEKTKKGRIIIELIKENGHRENNKRTRKLFL